MNIAYSVTGWRQVCTDACHAAGLLELCRVGGIPYDGFTACADGGIAIRLRCHPAHRLLTACQERELPVTVSPVRGLPALLPLIRRRAGILVGMALGMVLLVLSSQIVWDIRVSGTQNLSARDVKDTLAACGFTVGTSLRHFAADVTENRALLYDSRLAWISINRRGCVAYVQVRESAYPPADEQEQPANLVADRAGIVERVELVRGNLLVSAGQQVDQGQLLVSGLYDSERVGFRWTHAEGRVFARTVREYLIEIPLSYRQAQTTHPLDLSAGGYEKEMTLIFFGKNIKFSKKTGNEGVKCDTIESEKNLSLIPGIGFPISIRTTWYLPTAEGTGEDSGAVLMTRTPAEAEELAYMELARRISEIPGGAELLKKTVIPTLTEDCFRLQVTLVCVEDIARESVFEVTE